MKFCTSCGTKIRNASPFCTQCGTKLIQPHEPSYENSNNTSSSKQVQRNTSTEPGLTTSQPTQPVKPMFSKKTKILLASTAALFLIFLGLYKLGDSLTTSNKVLASFLEAVEEGNVDYLVDHLHSSDDSLEVTKKTVEDLLRYFSENPYVKEDLTYELERTATAFEESTNTSQTNMTGQLITFELRGKKYFLYDNYELVIHPQPLYVHTNYSDLSFYVENDEVAANYHEADLVYLGFYLPGYYEIKGVLTTDFLELEKDLHVSLFDDFYRDLYLDIDFIYIDSYLDDISVFINGQDSGVIIQAHGDEFGPVLLDGSMELQFIKETSFGKIVSPVYSIDEYNYYPSFTLMEEQVNDIYDTINNHLFQWSTARSDRDPSRLENITGSYQNQLFDTIDNLLYHDEYYLGYLTATKFDGNSNHVYYDGNNWITNISVLEDWMGTYVNSNGRSNFMEETLELNYSLLYDEGKETWVINEVNSAWGFIDDSNLKEFTFDGEEHEEAIADQIMTLTAENTDNFQSLFRTFLASSVDAINYRDFSLVSPLIDPDSSEYQKETADYIDYLDSRDIYEDFLGVEVTKVERESGDIFQVFTFEEYIIYYEDGSSKLKSFNSEYLVRMTDEGLKVNKLLKTNEVESIDR